MSYNNELYIFSEVPGYDSSKGEPGIVKAFRKLRKKVEHLEQVRINEKNTSQNVQANNIPDITITDVQSEFLLTQIRYIVKILREFGNNETSSEVNVNSSEQPRGRETPSNDNFQFQPVTVADTVKSKSEMSAQTDQDVLEVDYAFESEAKVSKNPENVQNPTNSHGKLPSRMPKSNSHPHYHLKLDDVPFILGASSSASHSVVANVQNIIALMKSHNKALCAPKVQPRSRSASSSHANKEANDMFREISEDLVTLSQKQKKLAEMFDNPPTHKYEKEMPQKKESSVNTKLKPQNPGTSSSSNRCSSLDRGKIQSRSKIYATGESSQMPTAPTVRIQSNSNPQLARRKMLRSLKDFKRHLSQEDISWE